MNTQKLLDSLENNTIKIRDETDTIEGHAILRVNNKYYISINILSEYIFSTDSMDTELIYTPKVVLCRNTGEIIHDLNTNETKDKSESITLSFKYAKKLSENYTNYI